MSKRSIATAESKHFKANGKPERQTLAAHCRGGDRLILTLFCMLETELNNNMKCCLTLWSSLRSLHTGRFHFLDCVSMSLTAPGKCHYCASFSFNWLEIAAAVRTLKIGKRSKVQTEKMHTWKHKILIDLFIIFTIFDLQATLIYLFFSNCFSER